MIMFTIDESILFNLTINFFVWAYDDFFKLFDLFD